VTGGGAAERGSSEEPRPLVIRPFEPADEADLVDVCLRTGASGEDASHLYASPTLLADVYATPYARHDPSLALVVENGSRVVGYVLATADTRAFAEWFSGVWWPSVRPDPVAQPDAELVTSVDDPQRMLLADVDRYPAHLHIDLLPEAQGRGLGRRLMNEMFDRLRERGVPAVHLALDPANAGAGVFYERLGFVSLLASNPDGSVRGLDL
jgi:ribosomal protein S18 acetylase RimI-like enzyme